MKATVHEGPQGGVEYRLWTGPDTFRVVSKYQALKHLAPEEQAKAENMERERKDRKRKQAENDAAWRQITHAKGGGVWTR